MNHRELEGIRSRAEQRDLAESASSMRVDRKALLAELERKWRGLERADDTIRQVREWVHNTEDAFRRDRDDNEASDLACELMAEVRKIVGPR